MADKDNRKESRTPITLKIKFKSGTVDQFIERYSVDISRGGIFIRTKDPLPLGTTLRFEFQLQDTSSLITGDGSVVWTRTSDAAHPGVAPGMGVRFDKLTGPSQQVLDRILCEKQSRGGDVLESRYETGMRARQSASGTIGVSDKHAKPIKPPASAIVADEPVKAPATETATADTAAPEEVEKKAKPLEENAAATEKPEERPAGGEPETGVPAKTAAKPETPAKKSEAKTDAKLGAKDEKKSAPAAGRAKPETKPASNVVIYVLVVLALIGAVIGYFAIREKPQPAPKRAKVTTSTTTSPRVGKLAPASGTSDTAPARP